MSKASKILWMMFGGYIGVVVILFIFKPNSPLPLLMIENIGNVLLGTLIIQFIIYTINQFMEGYKGK
jgi:hypothetical protein